MMDNFEEPHLKGAKQLTIEHLSKVKTLFKATLTKSLSIYLEKNMLVFSKAKYLHLFRNPTFSVKLQLSISMGVEKFHIRRPKCMQ